MAEVPINLQKHTLNIISAAPSSYSQSYANSIKNHTNITYDLWNNALVPLITTFGSAINGNYFNIDSLFKWRQSIGDDTDLVIKRQFGNARNDNVWFGELYQQWLTNSDFIKHGYLGETMLRIIDIWKKLYDNGVGGEPLNPEALIHLAGKEFIEARTQKPYGLITAIQGLWDTINAVELGTDSGFDAAILNMWDSMVAVESESEENFTAAIVHTHAQVLKNPLEPPPVNSRIDLIIKEIGGFNYNIGNFVDSRITQNETGLGGAWQESRVSGIEEDIETNRADISSINNTDLPTIYTRLVTLEQESYDWDENRVEGIETELSQHKLDYTSFINNVFNPLVASFNQLKDITVKNIRTEFDATKVQVNSHTTEINNLKDIIIPAMIDRITNVEIKLDKVDIQGIDDMKTRITDIETWQTNIANPSINSLINRVTQVETTINNLEIPDISSLTSDVNTLKTRMNTMVNSTIPNITGRIATIEAWKLEISENDFQTMNQEINNLVTWKNDIITPDIASIKAQLTNLESLIDDIVIPDLQPLLARLTDIENRLDTIAIDDISGLRTALNTLTDLVNSIPIIDIQPINDKIAELDDIVYNSISPQIVKNFIAIGKLENWKNQLVIPDIEPLILDIDTLETEIDEIKTQLISSLTNDVTEIKGELDTVKEILRQLAFVSTNLIVPHYGATGFFINHYNKEFKYIELLKISKIRRAFETGYYTPEPATEGQ